MTYLKGTGAPTRKSKGALGDIYTDTTTGKKYKCVFSYREAMNDEYDTQWKEVVGTGVKVSIDGKTISATDTNPEEKEVAEEEVTEKPVEPEVKKEEPKPEQPKKTANQKTNYAAYSKK